MGLRGFACQTAPYSCRQGHFKVDLKLLSTLSTQVWPPRSSCRLCRVSGGFGTDWISSTHRRGLRHIPAASRMGERYFQNTITMASELDGDDVTRTILKAAAAALKEVKACALQHRDVSGGGIYVGLGGVGLTYLRMAQRAARGYKYPHAAYLKKHSLSHSLALAGQFFAEADKLMTQKRVSFLEGASGLLACRAVLAHLEGDAAVLDTHIQELVGLWDRRICGVLPDGECELLYGRAGYLYSLTWLQQQLGRDTVPDSLIKAVVRHILDQGAAGAAELPANYVAQWQGMGTGSSSGGGSGRAGGGAGWPLMYSWHSKRYLGAAHGVAGILYVLLHHTGTIRQLDAEARSSGVGSRSSSSVGGGYMAAVTGAVDALAAATLPSGNLPTKLGDREDVRVAWCHGAAGLVLTMLKAADVLGDPQGRYMAAAKAAADDIWQRGLLKKGVGLCHGICGNGYALLALARATGELHYLRAARGFGMYAAEHWQELYDTPDRPASLFEGVAGAVNFWLDVVDPQHSRWPGAEL